MMVLLGHCGGPFALGVPQNPNLWWLQVLSDGESAVVTFFLLSGFVLALQLRGSEHLSYTSFILRRILRIWPAYAAVIILAFATAHCTETPVDAGPHIGPPTMPTGKDLAQNLLMSGNPYAIDPPAWSLYVEARLSVIFPLMYLCVVRLRMAWAIFLATVLSALLSRPVHWDLPRILLSFAEASRYIVLFVIGACLSRPGNAVSILYQRLPMAAKTAGFAIALLFVAVKFYPAEKPLPGAAYLGWLGVVLLFVFCLNSKRAEVLLDRCPLLFLGRISYGVYLVHYPVIQLLHKTLSSMAFVGSVLVTSILAGWAINRWVEEPCIMFGRRLTPSGAKTNPASRGSKATGL